MGEIVTNRSSLSILQDGQLSRLVSQPILASLDNTFSNSSIAPPSRLSQSHTGQALIYGFETHQADFSIWSLDPHLSDEQILDLLTTVDSIYWAYFTSPDQTFAGYFGLHYPQDGSSDPVNEPPHTQISITWPKHTKTHLLTRLRMLTRAGCERLSFWAELTGAIAAADQALDEGRSPKSLGKVTGVPSAFAILNSAKFPDQHQEPRIETIQTLARFLVAPWSPSKLPVTKVSEFDVCGRAFFWQALGKALWSPDCIRNAAVLFDTENTSWSLEFISNLADHWLNLVSFDQFEVVISGVKLKYKHDGDGILQGLWQQTVDLEYSAIPPQALKYLQSHQVYAKDTSLFSVTGGYDTVYGDALAKKLIAEAQQHKAFVPMGGFRTAMPTGMPLTGIEELCIWSDGESLWVLPLPGGLIFHWQPSDENHLSNLAPANDFSSAWNLILAALWHDLVTEGQKVIVRTGDDQPTTDTNHIESKKRRRRGHSRPDTHVLRLPSNRVVQMEGIHVWGTPEEIEKIKRQAHQVRGHRRKLSPGQQRSLYALANARNFSFILPDGYTFVKPYQTGLASPDAPAAKETPILARGLASLILMSKDYSKRSAV